MNCLAHAARAMNLPKRQANEIVGTDGDDVIRIRQTADGAIVINVNGQERTITAEQANQMHRLRTRPFGGLLIRGLDGNDRIEIDPSVTVNVLAYGGQGDDVIQGGSGQNWLFGGAGNDKLKGGRGRDMLVGGDGDDDLDGGDGDDVLYGLNGNDTLAGGKGNDYLDGGAGDDCLAGGEGRDVLFGGLGDDLLDGGDGDDVMGGGQGQDRYAGTAADRIYAQRNDTLPNGVTPIWVPMEGNKMPGHTIQVTDEPDLDPEFKAIVKSDLETLRSIPEGRQLLEAIDRSGKTVTIARARYVGGLMPYVPSSANPDDMEDGRLRPDGSRGPGTNCKVFYEPEDLVLYDGREDWQNSPPIAIFYHELVHAYNMVTGTLQIGQRRQNGKDSYNHEFQAVGLPNDGVLFDHDGDPDTPKDRDNPIELTENGFRRALRLPLRRWY